MSRWILLAVPLQIACLQTGSAEPEADATVDSRAEEVSADTSQQPETVPAIETWGPAETGPETTVGEVCVTAAPTQLSFGGHVIGTSSTLTVNILSCGSGPLVVNDVGLSDTANGQFRIAIVSAPLTLAPGQVLSVSVTYAPNTIAPFDGNDDVVLTTSSLVIATDAAVGELSVPLAGFGTDATCPVAVITVAEGDEVLPQTTLHLDGARSSSPSTVITSYEWTVTQPNGSVSMFLPSASVVAPSFQPNLVGVYVFKLTVYDAFGSRSCAAAEYEVLVTQDDAIHVELVWDTPGDPNQSDTSDPMGLSSAGSDVDLHFLSPKADGEMYSAYDCHFAAPNPEWGEFGPLDNPRLDRDDSDGAGPENLSLKLPEDGARYQVTAHYYDDWGLGDSAVTVRVYIYGALRDQWTTNLTMNDRWDAFYIDWPSTAVTRIGGDTPVIRSEPVMP